jgi:hypothetical protein
MHFGRCASQSLVLGPGFNASQFSPSACPEILRHDSAFSSFIHLDLDDASSTCDRYIRYKVLQIMKLGPEFGFLQVATCPSNIPF